MCFLYSESDDEEAPLSDVASSCFAFRRSSTCAPGGCVSQDREGYTWTCNPSTAPRQSCALQIHACVDDSALHGCYARAANVQLAFAKLLRTSDCFMAKQGPHCCIGSNHLGFVTRLCRWPRRGSKITLPKSIVLAASSFRTPSRAANYFHKLVCQMRRRMVRRTGQKRTSASHAETSDGSSSSQSGYPQKTAAP